MKNFFVDYIFIPLICLVEFLAIFIIFLFFTIVAALDFRSGAQKKS